MSNNEDLMNQEAKLLSELTHLHDHFRDLLTKELEGSLAVAIQYGYEPKYLDKLHQLGDIINEKHEKALAIQLEAKDA